MKPKLSSRALRLLRNYREATESLAFKGTQLAEDHAAIEREYKVAERELKLYIAALEAKK